MSQTVSVTVGSTVEVVTVGIQGPQGPTGAQGDSYDLSAVTAVDGLELTDEFPISRAGENRKIAFSAVANQPGGIPFIDDNGQFNGIIIHRIGTAAEINALVLAAGEIASTTDTKELRLGDGVTAGGTPLTSLMNSTSTLVVNAMGTPAENGAAFIAAHDAAANLTPNDAALSTSNRATVILMPGHYDTSAISGGTHYWDHDFVDIVGIAGSKHTFITGAQGHFVTDGRFKGMTLNSNFVFDTFPNDVAMTSNCEYEDIVMVGTMTVLSGAAIKGTYRRFKGVGNNMFRLALGSCDATFIDCEFTGSGLLAGSASGSALVFTGKLIRCTYTNTATWWCDMQGTMLDCDWSAGIQKMSNPPQIRNCRIAPPSGYAITHTTTGATAKISHCDLKNNGSGAINTTNVTNLYSTDTNVSDSDV